jgi:LEA14-like dessication related protein
VNKIKITDSCLFVFVLVVFLLSSCSAIEEIQVGNIRSIELKGIKNDVIDVELTIPVENPNGFKVKLKDADLVITSDKTLIGTIKQMDDIIIPARSKQECAIHVKVQLSNLTHNLFAIYGLFNNKKDLRLSGTIKVRAFPYRGKIKIKDYQLIN